MFIHNSSLLIMVKIVAISYKIQYIWACLKNHFISAQFLGNYGNIAGKSRARIFGGVI